MGAQRGLVVTAFPMDKILLFFFRFTGPPGTAHHTVNTAEKRLKKIASFHVVSLAISTLPRTVYVLTVFALNLHVERNTPLNTLHFFCNVLLLSNSIVDPIMFFVLYHQPCRRRNNDSNNSNNSNNSNSNNSNSNMGAEKVISGMVNQNSEQSA